jgi:hypothetical protein
MVWDTKHVVLAIVATAGIILAIVSYRDELRDRAQLTQTIAQQKPIIAAAEQRTVTRDQAATVAVQAIQATVKRAQTPSAELSAFNAYVPLPTPLALSPATDAPQGPGNKASMATVGANIPAEDLQPLLDFAASCKTCEIQLTTCKADLVDANTKVIATGKERDAAVAAVKGGTFWVRLKHNAKVVVITAAIVAAGVVATLKH